jgi:DNA-binding transcriptional MerR regulator
MVLNANIWTADALRDALAGGVSYAGQLANLTHDDFVEIVTEQGGRYIRFSNHGNFAAIVIGAAGLPVLPSGEPMALPSDRLISESEFCSLLNVQPPCEDDRLYTVAMLSQLMNIPESRINAWVKAGLIKPSRAERGVMRFEFRQAAVARTLVELTAAGVTIDKLRRTLRQLQLKMPDLKEPLQQLTILEHNGPLLVRLESGDLAEVSGQLQLEFDNQPQPEPVQLRLVPALTTAADWHEQAVSQERNGLLNEAEDSYRRALMLAGPNGQLSFDLASLLTKRGKIPAAIERYHHVIELEPNRADAWNNLAILLADSADLPSACDAFRRALQITPDDAKLHYNLADALDTLGYVQEAAPHWRAYLHYDPTNSPWAQHARERLQSA